MLMPRLHTTFFNLSVGGGTCLWRLSDSDIVMPLLLRPIAASTSS
jgi:hypothetical protein